ncbi:hypothetical protein ACHAXT_010268 [Thalassiosira profunda]
MSRAESVKVVLLGDSGVGKSSLALRFVTNEFRPYSEATIGASFMSKMATIEVPSAATGSPIKKSQSTRQRTIGFKIWDTAGQEKYRSLAPMYYRGASAAILVYDITKPDSFAALQDWASELTSNGPEGLVVAVCGNKSDLEEDRLVSQSTGESYANSIGALYTETSAKGGDGVESMFLEVAKKVPEPINTGEDYLEEDSGLDLGKSTEHQKSCC